MGVDHASKRAQSHTPARSPPGVVSASRCGVAAVLECRVSAEAICFSASLTAIGQAHVSSETSAGQPFNVVIRDHQ